MAICTSVTVPGFSTLLDALSTVPLVILSRIRRTADPQVLLIQAFALYASFLTAAWFKDASLLQAQWGLLRLAIPPGMALLGLILEDAYATPRTPIAAETAPRPLARFRTRCRFAGRLPGRATPIWLFHPGSWFTDPP